MSQITSQIQYELNIYEINSSVNDNCLTDFEDKTILQVIINLISMLESKPHLFQKMRKDLSSVIDDTNTFVESDTLVEKENDEMRNSDYFDFEINEFVQIPPKEIIIKKIKIKSIKKAKPVIFEE